jgi:4-hydroxy-3-polyprenylbenzoate decarboxylase
MPCAIVLGCPPYVAFMGPQKLPVGVDEFTVAGGLAGAPVNVVKARTVDLLVPAESELVIEGLIDTEYWPRRLSASARPRRAREYNMPMRATAITHRSNAVIPLHQPGDLRSRASPRRLDACTAHLREALEPRGREITHEPSRASGAVVTVERGAPRTEVWRALYGAAYFKADMGKITIAVICDMIRTIPTRFLGDGLSHEPDRGRAALRTADRDTGRSASTATKRIRRSSSTRP